ncbi:hypothetical protein AAHE18_04G105500 [Arachis hypogaea]
MEPESPSQVGEIISRFEKKGFYLKSIIATGRKLIVATNPLASEPGTIHGDFAIALEGVLKW